MYSHLFFSDMSWKPLKISEKGVHRPAFSKYSLITPSRGWQRVTWLTGIPLWIKCTCCANSQVTKIQGVPWFCNSTYIQKGRRPNLCVFFLFHIIHLCKQTINQTKYLVLLLLTFNKQEKSIYVAKSIGHFSPLMLPLAVSQLNTS